MVVDVYVGEVGLGLGDEVDGGLVGLGFADSFKEAFGGIDAAVDADNLLAGSHLGFIRWAVPADVVDETFCIDAQAERIPDIGASAAASACTDHGGFAGVGFVGVDELVAALLDTRNIRAWVEFVYAVVEECGPVIFDNLVEIGDELFAGVSDDERAGVAPFAQEDMLKVVE